MSSGLADIPTSQNSWASSVPNHQVSGENAGFLVLKKIPHFFLGAGGRLRWALIMELCPGGDAPWFRITPSGAATASMHMKTEVHQHAHGNGINPYQTQCSNLKTLNVGSRKQESFVC